MCDDWFCLYSNGSIAFPRTMMGMSYTHAHTHGHTYGWVRERQREEKEARDKTIVYLK